jgi:hypothetical protein
MNKSHIARILTVTVTLSFGNIAFSAGISMIDPAATIKISESRSYSCNNGKVMQLLDSGRKEFLVYRNKPVSCHDDKIWLDGKALSFVDLVNLAAAETSK